MFNTDYIRNNIPNIEEATMGLAKMSYPGHTAEWYSQYVNAGSRSILELANFMDTLDPDISNLEKNIFLIEEKMEKLLSKNLAGLLNPMQINNEVITAKMTILNNLTAANEQLKMLLGDRPANNSAMTLNRL